MNQLGIAIVAVATHHCLGVECGRRDHHQNLARRRLDGHRSTHLARHQLLAEALQTSIDGARDAQTRHRKRVVQTLTIRTLDGTSGVALQDLHTLRASQILLVGFLHTAHTHIVLFDVLGIVLQKTLGGFVELAQQVATHVQGVVTSGAAYGVEALKTEGIKAQLLLLRDIFGHQEGLTTVGSGIGQHTIQLAVGQSQQGLELERIETFGVHLTIDHHQIVALTALGQVFATTVEDLATRRKLDIFTHHIGLGTNRVTLVKYLYVGHTADEGCKDDGYDNLQHTHSLKAFRAVYHCCG